MKIVCISDTHSLHDLVTIPEGDMLIHAGDMTNRGSIKDLVKFNNWIKVLPHKYKIIIAGNHDFCWEKDHALSRAVLNESIVYLIDNMITIEDINIYGSPWQPRFFDWAFNVDRGTCLKAKWDKIPMHTDILITHGPPKNILDKCERDNRVGCEDLLNRINEVKPKYHIFGHIHEGYGTKEKNNITFVNASICNKKYNPCNKPIIIEI